MGGQGAPFEDPTATDEPPPSADDEDANGYERPVDCLEDEPLAASALPTASTLPTADELPTTSTLMSRPAAIITSSILRTRAGWRDNSKDLCVLGNRMNAAFCES